MNRSVSTNLDAVLPDRLPPRKRSGAARLLFVHGNILGFRNVGAALERATAGRDDVDAVHVHLEAPTWLKVLGKSIPGLHGRDFHQDRHLRLWGRLIEGWFRGPLDLGRFDAVHLMTQVHAWALVRWRRRRGEGVGARPRFAVNVDSTAALEIEDFGTSAAGRASFRRAEQAMFGLADLVVCRNDWVAPSLERHYGLPASRVHVARNSIALPDAHRDWSRPPGERTKLVFVGNNWKRKGGDLVLGVHQAKLADRCELHVLGDRVERDDSARNVVWHGRVPRERLIDEILPAMDVFVLASRYDMLPWAVLEGAAAGLPVVAPATGAIPDVVVDGETGRLFAPGDGAGLAAALDGLVGDPAAMARMGRAARARVAERFRADVTYPALVDRLVRLASEHAP